MELDNRVGRRVNLAVVDILIDLKMEELTNGFALLYSENSM